MKSKINVIKLAGITALGGLLSLSAMAFQGGHGTHFLHELDLTEGQQAQLKSWRETHREDRQQARATMKALKEKKQTLLVNYDDAQAQSIAMEEAELHKARVLKQLEREQAIYAMLTDEQKNKFVELTNKMSKSMRKGHRQKGDSNKASYCAEDD